MVRAVEGLHVVYHRQENAGPATARNWALRRATGAYVLITGDDILPDPELIARHLAAHRQRPDPKVAVVGQIDWSDEQDVSYFMDYITGAGGQQFNFAELERLDRENLPAGWFLTSNISLKRAWLRRTGELFDERFPHAAYEDIGLGLRLQTQHGLRLAHASDAVGHHLHHQTYASFSRRQYEAGRSAATLIELHPELAEQMLAGDLPARLTLVEGEFAAHEQAISALEARLESGERLSDDERTALDGHYAAALETHHLRGLCHARDGEEPRDVYSYGRQNWFPAVGEEHRAVRERAGLFDQSSFAKFLMAGPDAAAALTWICANDIDKPVGSLTYTQMCDARGGIQCDLTVARLAEDAFYIVTGTGFATHDFSWIARNIPDGLDAALTDVTPDFATFSLMGPRARDILSAVTRDDVSHEGFPFATCREIAIDGAALKALRLTYVGELGWELHVPTEHALMVYQRVMAAGAEFGIANAGYRAIESLRLEKGYRAWGSDIGPDYTPFEAGLGWAVKLKKNVPFQGREALAAQHGATLDKRLACFTLDDPDVVLLGRETIYRNGQRVGWLTSAGWGYTMATNIGYGYVRNKDGVDDAFLHAGDYELEVATERLPCRIHRGPLYDPKMARIKA
ncbi:MAG: glycosyltransferase [Proteobacteria bacterium]|nr:glycosyltransferase [Pseudomonadota bacterium]